MIVLRGVSCYLLQKIMIVSSVAPVKDKNTGLTGVEP